MRLTSLILVGMAFSAHALSAHALEIVPRSIGSGANHAYLHLQFQDAAMYVFDVRFDSGSVTTRQMVDAVAAELPLTYTTQFSGYSLYGLTYDGHQYEDWSRGFWSLWSSPTGAAPWTYSQAGWMLLTASNGQWHGLVADPNFTYNASPAPITLVSQTGDFTGDGRADGLDFLRWQSNFPNNTGQATQWRGDGNGDGKVDGLDFLAWQSDFDPGAAPAPEPFTAALLAMGILALPRRRRQG